MQASVKLNTRVILYFFNHTENITWISKTPEAVSL